MGFWCKSFQRRSAAGRHVPDDCKLLGGFIKYSGDYQRGCRASSGISAQQDGVQNYG
jgi:hypothetical protein